MLTLEFLALPHGSGYSIGGCAPACESRSSLPSERREIGTKVNRLRVPRNPAVARHWLGARHGVGRSFLEFPAVRPGGGCRDHVADRRARSRRRGGERTPPRARHRAPPCGRG